MNLNRAAIVSLTLLFAAPGALAQFPAKGSKPPTKAPAKATKPGTKYGRTPKKWKALENRYEAIDGISSSSLLLRGGGSVRGRITRDTTHKLRIPAPIDGKLTVKASSSNTRIPLTGTLVDPAGNTVATLLPEKGKEGRYQITDLDLGSSGIFTLSLTAPTTELTWFDLTATIDLPNRLAQDIEVEGGRPFFVEFGGLEGRKLDNVTLRGGDPKAPLSFFATLVDPDGIPVDLEPYLSLSKSGDLLTLKDLPIGIDGTYRLTFCDRNRATGSAKLSIRYDNPPPSTITHRL